MSFLLYNATNTPQTITVNVTPVTIPGNGKVSLTDGDLSLVVQSAGTASLFQYGLLYPRNADGSSYTGSVPVGLQPVGFPPKQSNLPATGRALVADLVAASTAVGTSPAPMIWPNVRNTLPDTHYDPVTGVYTFTKDVFWFSTAMWYIVGSQQRAFYADAETSVDGGTTWVRGTNSLRIEQANIAGRSVNFPFQGVFPAGAKLRYVIWASDTGLTINTVAEGTSTSPASRITLVTLDANKVTV